ncbi:curli-like amyloid fiber formation chaperone CsgH [Endozoicomonas arenosclerae]|uniref:curli-like amyloid fiber formation chaperone CsgH n=1 Tax=Endozoicomonas arenosclerae TaxID=1633495 RepID=UPI001C12BD01|nr:curli-like amyloid fiber formation chaperone CsgH [Endozoicomonas arenosclerae]
MSMRRFLRLLSLTSLLFAHQVSASEEVLIEIQSTWVGETLYLTPSAISLHTGIYQYRIEARKSGKHGNAVSRQSRQIKLSPDDRTTLSKIAFNLSNDDQLALTITLTDKNKKSTRLERSFSVPETP